MSNLSPSKCSVPLSVLGVPILGLLIGMALLALAVGTARADPGTIYVDADAPGPTHDGDSWATAYTSVQDALGAAAYGDEIWVAEGVYYPDEGVGQTDKDRDSTFRLRPGVALYGGFDPQSSADEWVERDWDAHVTVLSGDIDGDDVTDGDGVVTDTTNIKNSNAYHVVTGGGVTETARLDGFTVTAGWANGGPSAQKRGGGMLNQDSDPTLANVSFSGNRAELGGGGMHNEYSAPTLTHVTFSANRAVEGGGMYNYPHSSPTLTDVVFRANQADQKGGGMHNEHYLQPTLTNVIFSGNQSGDTGGGMYNAQRARPKLTNVLFSGNQAESGGGMYNYNDSNPKLTNVTFSGNRADQWGGGIYDNLESNPVLINCILWGNAAPNASQIFNAQSSSPTISYSDVQDAFAGGAWDGALGSDGGNNIDADPLFVAPLPASAAPTTEGDYRLRMGSPAIDVGDNLAVTVATDLDGNPRILDGDRDDGAVVDMGAYEAQPPVGGVTLARSSFGSLPVIAVLAALVELLLVGAAVVRRRGP